MVGSVIDLAFVIIVVLTLFKIERTLNRIESAVKKLGKRDDDVE